MPLGLLPLRLGRALRLGDGLVRLGLHLPHAVLALDGVLRRLHGAVDGLRDVLRQPQRPGKRELVDDEAVLAQDVAALLRHVVEHLAT